MRTKYERITHAITDPYFSLLTGRYVTAESPPNTSPEHRMSFVVVDARTQFCLDSSSQYREHALAEHCCFEDPARFVIVFKAVGRLCCFMLLIDITRHALCR